MSLWRTLGSVLVIMLTVAVCWVNIAVHQAPSKGSEAEVNRLKGQLRYLEPRMHTDLGAAMQSLFPEGSAFAHVLYGLSWSGLAIKVPDDAALRMHARTEAHWALAQLDHPSLQAQFAMTGALPTGVFHSGWRDLLIGSICLFDPTDSALQARWDEETHALVRAFAASPSPYLGSYEGMAWPADATVAMASIALHHRHRNVQDRAVIERWAAQVRLRLDDRGLMPHEWDPVADRLLQGGRGSSQALMNVLLPVIDSALSREQYTLFQEHFFSEQLGVPVVREHPRGASGRGDVDSGPLILGVGPAATIVGASAACASGDVFHAQEFAATVDGFGFVTGGEHPRYLFGALPIADLFIAWGRSQASPAVASSYPRFLRFHGWSVMVLLLIWAPWWWRFVRGRWSRSRIA
jgi:hypothetical protein